MGRVPQALDLSLLVGYLFARSFLFILKAYEGEVHLIYAHSPVARTTPDRDPLNGTTAVETRNPLPLSPRWRKKKINGRIRMNFIN